MSSLNIDSSLPQSLSTCVDQQELPTSLPEYGFLQTCYSLHIADIKIPSSDSFSKEHVNALYNFSKIIKTRQNARVVLKWLNSFRDVISNVDNFLRDSNQEPLTQASFCKNVYAGAYYLDKRVRMIVPRIINMISHIDTCQADWKELLDTKKNQALDIT